MEAVKRCGRCRREKSPGEFNRDAVRPDGLYPTCKDCRHGEYLRAAERKRAYQRRYRTENLARVATAKRAWYFRSRYGITLEDRERMLEAQSYACAMCGAALVGGRQTHVDHCHVSGVVRGILCLRCNTVLGFVEDAALMALATGYLARTKEAA